MDLDFTMTVKHKGARTTLVCRGELDLLTSPKLKEALTLCVESTPDVLQLDLSGLSLLTSSGIEALLGCLETCRTKGVRLELELSVHARRMLDIAGLWWVGVIEDGLAAERSMQGEYERNTRDGGSLPL